MGQTIKDRVKALEQQNRLLTGKLIDAVWVMNAGNLIYEYITPSIHQISGFTPDELLHASIADRLTPDSLNRATTLLEDALEAYVSAHTDSDFTHTVCLDCRDILYPDLEQ